MIPKQRMKIWKHFFQNMLIQVDMLIWQPVAYMSHIFFTSYLASLPALGIEIIFTKQRHITYDISVVGNPDGQKYISIMFSNWTVIMINVFVIWWCQYYRSHATSGLFTQFNEAKKNLKLHSHKFQILWKNLKKFEKNITLYFGSTLTQQHSWLKNLKISHIILPINENTI